MPTKGGSLIDHILFIGTVAFKEKDAFVSKGKFIYNTKTGIIELLPHHPRHYKFLFAGFTLFAFQQDN